EKLLQDKFPFYWTDQLRLAENPRSIPETLYLKDGRLVSNVYYWHLHTVFRCRQDFNPKIIFEIGGGYGAIARLWMHLGIDRYFIIDLPESLFFAEVALRTEFPGKVGYWDGSDPGTKIVLVPVSRADAKFVGRIDLVTSIGSLQEMSDTWVDFYMGWISRNEPKFFYSMNYMGSALTIIQESRNFWSPRLSNKWATRYVEAEVPLIKMMCTGRDFVEAGYELATPQRKFSEWSVLHGHFFNRQTYLEGLELLRQDFTVETAATFLFHVTL